MTPEHPGPEHEEHDMAGQPTCTTLPDGSKTWYLHGGRHRTDGPAVEWADGGKEHDMTESTIDAMGVEG